MASPNLPPSKRAGGLVRQLALAMELPFVLIGTVLIGGGIGYFIDRSLHTSPAVTLVGGFFGFGVGVWDIIRRLGQSEKQGNDDGGR